MPWVDETVDAISNLIANYGLYQRLNLTGLYIEGDDDVSPEQMLPISQADPVLRYCPHEKCKAERPHKKTAYQTGFTQQYGRRFGNRIRSLLYNCTNCGSAFWCWIEISEQFMEGDRWIRKVGQLPSYEVSVASDLENSLGQDATLYKRAQICMSQSYGIAACAYLRRLLENQIVPLLQLVYEARKEEGEDVSAFAEITNERVAENKIRFANKVLPNSVLVPGENPLELIYDRLSAGLHRQSEDECMEIAHEASQVLEHTVISINDESQQRQSKNQYVKRIRKMRSRSK